MEEELDIALNERIKKAIKASFFPATVSAINDDDTVDVDDDALRYYGVRLKSVVDGRDVSVIAVPEKGSQVLVGRLMDSDTALFVSKVNDLKELKISFKGGIKLSMNKDALILNGGNNGGLIKIEDLVRRLNKLEDAIKNHQHYYIPYPAGSAAPPVKTTKDPFNTFNNTRQAELENPKIKH